MLIYVSKLSVILMTEWNSNYHLKNIKRVDKLQLIDEVVFDLQIRTLDLTIIREY